MNPAEMIFVQRLNEQRQDVKRLNDLKGGRGKCPLCEEWHSNVAYHQAHECKKRKKTKRTEKKRGE